MILINNFFIFIKKVIEINPELKKFIFNIYFRSFFYIKRHIKKDNYEWLKKINLQILNKYEGKFIYQDLQYIIPKNNYKNIPLHQKYLYAALISKYLIPKYFLLFWDSLIVINELFFKNLYYKEFKINKGDIVFDIGASIGWYACKISKFVGDEGKIIAIEPNPKLFNFLMKNINLNNLNNIKPLNIGVWSSKKDLYLLCEGYGSSLRGYNGLHANNNIIKVKVNTIDNLIKEFKIEKTNLIKMDIEGAEIEALLGAKNTLKNFDMLKLIIAAYHKNKNGVKSYKILAPLLKKISFKIKSEDLPFIIAWKELN